MVENLLVFNQIVCCTSAEALEEHDLLLVTKILEYDGGSKERLDSGEGGRLTSILLDSIIQNF